MPPPLVSVVIPTYNRAYCVARTIDSALAQTHQNLEILVVDDGSKDDTAAVIRARYGREPRVRYVFQENTGVSGARNHGMAESRGEFVALLDSDDIWFPWKIEAQLAVLRNFPEAGMVWSDMEAIDSEGRMLSPCYLRTMYTAFKWFGNDELFDKSIRLAEVAPELPEPARTGHAYCGDIHSQMVMGSLVHTSTVLLRRDRMLRVGEFVSKYTHGGEDFHFHLRTCREGPVALLDLPTIQYQRGFADQITRPGSQLNFSKSFLDTIETELAEHGDRIRLPKWMIREVLAEAHGWIGDSALSMERRGLARRELVRSLLIKPLQTRLWKLLLLASLPATVDESLRTMYRWFKAPVSKPESKTMSAAVVEPVKENTYV
ncbi:MAG: glycosyltransferase family 2 protein [Planctomycetales bacterium]|nr:glycosyltransferase family 2 protein [Planctomycetales bacterium]